MNASPSPLTPVTPERSASDDFGAQLKHWQTRAQNALDGALPNQKTVPQRLHEAMRYTTLNGGKRIRACLVYATGETLGADTATLDAPACAIEIIHAYSLIHDDLPCMDNDDLRRGKPTCHKAFDEATAVLAGDALQALAFEILANQNCAHIDVQRQLRMVQELALAGGSHGMAGGQAIDLAAVGKPLSLRELEAMHQRKTGALIRAAVRLGMLACTNISSDIESALDNYGRTIGLAFQVADDILDVIADTATLGKRQGADAALNKPTFPQIIGLDEAQAKAQALYTQALEHLGLLGDNGSRLAHIANYIVNRRY